MFCLVSIDFNLQLSPFNIFTDFIGDILYNVFSTLNFILILNRKETVKKSS